MLKVEDFFNLEETVFTDLFKDSEYVWDPLKKLSEYIKTTMIPNVAEIRAGSPHINNTLVLYNGIIIDSGFTIQTEKKKLLIKKDNEILEGASVIYAGAILMDDNIFIGKNTIIEPGALIKGPTIIGNNTEIRQGAYIRGDVLVGDFCVVGHATEVKSSILIGESKAGHFAYIGDSILGKVNLGAGTKLANLKIVKSGVVLQIKGKRYDTGLRKFGAILADNVETGCNSVTSPGTLLGKNVIVYPNATVRGYHPSNSIIKVRQNQLLQEKR